MGILKGKLVKKEDNKILKNLEIQEFPWLDFKEKNIVFPDNPRRSVILQKFHDPKEMREKVKEASLFKENLEKKSTPLYPIDLTDDYNKGIRELAKRKRRRMMGEEEAMALELAEISQESNFQIQFKSPHAQQQQRQPQAQPQPQSALNHNLETNKVGDHNINIIPSADESKIIIEKKDVIDESKNIISDKKEDNKFINSDVPVELKRDEQQAEKQAEKQSVEHETKNEVQLDEKKRDEIEKEWRDKGYLDGFREGEERAVKAQESKYESVFKNIAHVVDQIEKLKDALYAESKDVFIEIIKLCSEKILREQLKFSDNALFSLFDEVIKSISQKSSLKIELNSQDAERLKQHIEKLGIKDRVTLKVDESKQSGDFNVESDRGVSIVSLQKSIENLVDKLKLELFSEEVENKIA